MKKENNKWWIIIGVLILLVILSQGDGKKESNYLGDDLDDCLYADNYGRIARIAYYEEKDYSAGYVVSPCYEVNSASISCTDELDGLSGYVIFFHTSATRSFLKDWEQEALSCLEQYSTPETGNGGDDDCDASDDTKWYCTGTKLYDGCNDFIEDCAYYTGICSKPSGSTAQCVECIVDSDCPGNGDCRDNYCHPEEIEEVTCSDTDSGINYGIKGTVTSNYIGGTDRSWYDYCSGNTLNEYYCTSDNEVGQDSTHYCPYGCSNGVCLSSTLGLIEVSRTIKSYDDLNVENKIVGTFVLKNNGAAMTSNWILEMQVNRLEQVQAVYVSPQKTCVASTPYNVHKEFKLGAGEQTTIELTSSNIPESMISTNGNTFVLGVITEECGCTETSCYKAPYYAEATFGSHKVKSGTTPKTCTELSGTIKSTSCTSLNMTTVSGATDLSSGQYCCKEKTTTEQKTCTSNTDCDASECQECKSGYCISKCAGLLQKCESGECETNSFLIIVGAALLGIIMLGMMSKGKK